MQRLQKDILKRATNLNSKSLVILGGTLVALIILAVTVASCWTKGAAPKGAAPDEYASLTQSASEQTSKTVSEGSQPSNTQSNASTGNESQAANQERMVIHEATFDITVPDVRQAVSEIRSIANEAGGYVTRSEVKHHQHGYRATVVVRVPSDSGEYADVLQRVRNLATRVTHEKFSGEDVTKKYVDLESRLRHLETTEDRLMDFLEGSEDTEAALTVHDRLKGIEAEMEQVKGEMQYLEESAAMATITLNLSPDEASQPVQVERWRPAKVFKKAVERLVDSLQSLADKLITFFIYYVPMMIVILLVITVPLAGLFFLTRAIIRGIQKRKEQTQNQVQDQ